MWKILESKGQVMESVMLTFFSELRLICCLSFNSQILLVRMYKLKITEADTLIKMWIMVEEWSVENFEADKHFKCRPNNVCISFLFVSQNKKCPIFALLIPCEKQERAFPSYCQFKNITGSINFTVVRVGDLKHHQGLPVYSVQKDFKNLYRNLECCTFVWARECRKRIIYNLACLSGRDQCEIDVIGI